MLRGAPRMALLKREAIEGEGSDDSECVESEEVLPLETFIDP